jgi:hypothetical protein
MGKTFQVLVSSAIISFVERCDPSTPDLLWEIASPLHPILI